MKWKCWVLPSSRKWAPEIAATSYCNDESTASQSACPHISSVPTRNQKREKDVQFTVSLIPCHLFPFVSLLRTHWSCLGPWIGWMKTFSLKFCNYVLLVSHYCFAHITWRTCSIAMQKKPQATEKKLMLGKDCINEALGALLTVKSHLESKEKVLLNIWRNLWEMQCSKLSLLFPLYMLWIFIAVKTNDSINPQNC